MTSKGTAKSECVTTRKKAC